MAANGGHYRWANTGGGVGLKPSRANMTSTSRDTTLSDLSRISRTAVIDHLLAHSVRTDGPFTLISGEVSDWYIDARQTTFDGAGAIAVGQAIADLLPENVVGVGGMTMGADPMAVATAAVASQAGRPLKAFSIRKESKTHGTGGRLVGPLKRGDVVGILEDTTTTGSALIEAIDVATNEGLVVALAIALVDRSDGVVALRLVERGIPYTALVVPSQLGL